MNRMTAKPRNNQPKRPALFLALVGVIACLGAGCETAQLVQDDVERGIDRGFAALDNGVANVDDATHRWRHGY